MEYFFLSNELTIAYIQTSEKNKDILIHFINDILGYKGDNAVKEVEYLSPVQEPEIAIKKQSIVDVLCKDKKGIQFIIEMQVLICITIVGRLEVSVSPI